MARAAAVASKPSSTRTFSKVLIAVVAIGGIAFVFWRTVNSARSEAYKVSSGTRGPWQLSTIHASGPTEPVMVLEPPRAFERELFDQVFKRSMESMRAPEIGGIPLVFAGELERAGAARPTPDELAALVRDAGLDAAPPTARCMGHRRHPEPATREQAYFVVFDSPAFARFRASLGARLGSRFDPTAASPAMLVGTIESAASDWLPLRADPEKDCVAPLAVAP
jgi:hypothetical protein